MLSCNAKGLRDKLKRKNIFKKLMSSQCIIFCQETYSTPDIENSWDKEWPDQIIYIHGENNARGTIITFNPKLHSIVDD